MLGEFVNLDGEKRDDQDEGQPTPVIEKDGRWGHSGDTQQIDIDGVGLKSGLMRSR